MACKSGAFETHGVVQNSLSLFKIELVHNFVFKKNQI